MEFFTHFKEILSKSNDFSLVTLKSDNSKSLNNKSFGQENMSNLETYSKADKKVNYLNTENFKIYKKSRIFFVVNKYNEIIQTSSRLIFSNSQRPKPLYLGFMSKDDSIDFLYKIASSEPKAFKKLGLGINSFPIDKYIKLANKGKKSFDMVLLNDLKEVENLFSSSKSFNNKVNFINKKDFNSTRPFNGIIAYKIVSEEEKFSNIIFLSLKDLSKEWDNLLNTNLQKNKYKRCNVQILSLSLKEISNLIKN